MNNKVTIYFSSSWYIKDTELRRDLKNVVIECINNIEVSGKREDTYNTRVLDPFEHDIPVPDRKAKVERDKRLIDQSDIMVALTPFPTYGTSMEIMYAYMKGKPCFIIDMIMEGFSRTVVREHNIITPKDDYWLSYHCCYDRVFTTLEDFKQAFTHYLYEYIVLD